MADTKVTITDELDDDDLPDDLDDSAPQPAKKARRATTGRMKRTAAKKAKAGVKAAKKARTKVEKKAKRASPNGAKPRPAKARAKKGAPRLGAYKAGQMLYGKYGGRICTVKVTKGPDGLQFVMKGKQYSSPSAAGRAFNKSLGMKSYPNFTTAKPSR